MPFTTVSAGITLKVPTAGTKNYQSSFLSEFATKISEHDHSGSGKGLPLTASAFSDNAVTGAKVRLANAEFLRARNAANDGDVNILKVNSDDAIEFGGAIGLANDTYYTGRNAGDSADIDIIKVNSSNTLTLGANLAGATLSGSLLLSADNTFTLGNATNGLSGLFSRGITAESGSLTLNAASTESVIARTNGANRLEVADTSGNLVFLADGGCIVLGAETEVTIASGVANLTKNKHSIDTEGNASTDDVSSFSGLPDNGVCKIHPADDARTVVIKHGTGNIRCHGSTDISLANDNDWVEVMRHGSIYIVSPYSLE